MTESEIEAGLINKLVNLKYTNRPDIRDRQALERNFRQKFEDLNYVRLTDSEFTLFPYTTLFRSRKSVV